MGSNLGRRAASLRIRQSRSFRKLKGRLLYRASNLNWWSYYLKRIDRIFGAAISELFFVDTALGLIGPIDCLSRRVGDVAGDGRLSDRDPLVVDQAD